MLVVVGLVILGPERLPGAIRWTSTALRQARDYLSGVTSQLREDIGPEFDDLRGAAQRAAETAWHDAARGADQAPARRRRLHPHRKLRQAGQRGSGEAGGAAKARPDGRDRGAAVRHGQHVPGHTPFDTDAT